jgi:hypothetical protein
MNQALVVLRWDPSVDVIAVLIVVMFPTDESVGCVVHPAVNRWALSLVPSGLHRFLASGLAQDSHTTSDMRGDSIDNVVVLPTHQ